RTSGSVPASFEKRSRSRSPPTDVRITSRRVTLVRSALEVPSGTLPGLSTRGGGKVTGGTGALAVPGASSGVTAGGANNGSAGGVSPGGSGAATYSQVPTHCGVDVFWAADAEPSAATPPTT